MEIVVVVVVWIGQNETKCEFSMEAFIQTINEGTSGVLGSHQREP